MAVSCARVKYVRMSPRKAREVARLVNNKSAREGLELLSSVGKAPAVHLKKGLESCMANARDKGVQDPSTCKVRIRIDDGPCLKRFRAASMGRAVQIRKRLAHVFVELI